VADEVLIEAAATSRADPERSASSIEIAEGIEDCLAGLARPRRLAVTLWLLGCGVPEIARRRAWSYKRAHNLVYRGLDNLRACLLRKGFQP
jgi:DNA-directed RNA polymerase specialized sigma24 family protein